MILGFKYLGLNAPKLSSFVDELPAQGVGLGRFLDKHDDWLQGRNENISVSKGIDLSGFVW